MILNRVVAALSAVALTLVNNCDAALVLPDGSTWGLKNAYNGTFTIGVSTLKNSIFKKEPTSSLIKQNYEALVTETDLVWSSVEYKENQWFWDDVDEYVSWCEQNGIEPIGHCLVWKGIGWMSYYPAGMSDKERYNLYMTRIEDWIKTAMTRYRDRIKRWVVVNEWFNLTGQIRDDQIMPSTLGTDGVEASLRWAKQYGTSDMSFYFSENSFYIDTKYTAVMKYYKKLRTSGYKIDGVFFQGHMYQNNGVVVDAVGPHTHAGPTDYDRALRYIGKTGFKIVFSEWDISVLPDAWSCCRNTSLYDFPPLQQKALNPFAAGLPTEVDIQLRKKWSSIMKVLLKNKQYITDVHFWGLNDNLSWYNKWPVRGRTDYPTLFDRDNQPKPAYFDLLRMAPNQPPAGVEIPNIPFPVVTSKMPTSTPILTFTTTASSLTTAPPAGIKQIPTTNLNATATTTSVAEPTKSTPTITTSSTNHTMTTSSSHSVVVVTATRTVTVPATEPTTTSASG